MVISMHEKRFLHLLRHRGPRPWLTRILPGPVRKGRIRHQRRCATTGSSILRSAITFQIPLNKRYNELSVEERVILHKAWEGIPDGDEPPFPTNGLRPIYKAVIDAQSKLGVEGELHLIATVDARGDVVEVKAYGSPSPEITQFAATVILKTKFKPAVCGGQPCRMDFPFRYRFVLELQALRAWRQRRRRGGPGPCPGSARRSRSA